MNVTIHNVVIATVRDKHGNITDKRFGHNSITDHATPVADTQHNGRFYLLERLFDNGEEYDPDNPIGWMHLGTGTSGDLGDTGLATPYKSYKAIATVGSINVSTPAAPFLTSRSSWTAGDGALAGVSEVGLFANDTDNVLFAYKTFSPALTKTAGGTLDIDWVVTMS